MATVLKPGEFVLQTLLHGFQSLTLQKIENCMQEKSTNLSNSLKCDTPEDDQEFEHILQAWHTAAEYSLPSLIVTLFDWHNYQHSKGALFPLKSELFSGSLGAAGPNSSDGSPKLSGASLGSLPSWLLSMPMEERALILQRRDLAVDYIFCVVLVRLLPQLTYHPGHEDLICRILDQAFLHFQYCADLCTSPNSRPINMVADKYAEVVGCLSQLRFSLVKRKFVTQLKELRMKEQNTLTVQSLISLLIGMKFFRVQMHPIEAFVDCFTFLQELAQYFIEVREKEIRHALAGLFVEILLPVAAVLKHEANIPALRIFVDMLYNPCLEMASKKKHILALFPLITCLLCVAQKVFFYQNWPYFMNMCLGQLKNRDTRLARVSLESLVRLLWVYIIRYKCEKPTETHARLTSITSSLFPKNAKFVIPKDAPNSLFIKVIHFISQERLNFAMTEIVFDLLGIGRAPIKMLVPERMNIGLCAFLVIAHSLQQREGEPPMPHHHLMYQHPQRPSHSPNNGGRAISGTMSRVKRCLAGETLTEATAHSLGIQPYVSQVRKAFDSILRLLDNQVVRNQQPWINEASNDANNTSSTEGGKVASVTSVLQGLSNAESNLGTERDPKLELLRTCVCAIPRLLPSDMNKKELIHLICRITLHSNLELRQSAHATLYHLVLEFPAWRSKVLRGFVNFFRQDIPDTSPTQMEMCARILYNLLCTWRVGISKDLNSNNSSPQTVPRDPLFECEGFCIALLCYYFGGSPSTSATTNPLSAATMTSTGITSANTVRRLAVMCLREIRTLCSISIPETTSVTPPTAQTTPNSNLNASVTSSTSSIITQQPCCIDVMDAAVESLLPAILPHIIPSEQHYILATHAVQPLDFLQITERCISHWMKSSQNSNPNINYNTPFGIHGSSSPPPVTSRLVGRLHSNTIPVDKTQSPGASSLFPSNSSAGLGESQPSTTSITSMISSTIQPPPTTTTDHSHSPAAHSSMMKERASTLPSPFIGLSNERTLTSSSLESGSQSHFDKSHFLKVDGLKNTTQYSSWSGTVASSQPSDQDDDVSVGYIRNYGMLYQLQCTHGVVTNMDLQDIWSICLAHILNWRHLLLRCPTAMRFSHQYGLDRLNAIYNLVDPNAQLSENRASVLIRNATKTRLPEKPEPSYLYPLFRNYAILCCAVAPSSTGVRLQLPHYVARHGAGNWSITLNGPTHQRLHSVLSVEHPGLSVNSEKYVGGNNPGNVSTASQGGAGTAISSNTAVVTSSAGKNPHLKLLGPLLRCEVAELRDAAISALGRIAAPNFRDVLEEIHVHMKDCVDTRKQDSGKRKLRRDNLRCYLVHILNLMAQHDVFAFSESVPSISLKTLVEFLEAVGNMESGSTLAGLINVNPTQQLATRKHFCQFFIHLVRRMPRERRQTCLNAPFKQQIFSILSRWAGRYFFEISSSGSALSDGGQTHVDGPNALPHNDYSLEGYSQPQSDRPLKDKMQDGSSTDLEFLACQAMVALLCCGPLFNKSYLLDEPRRLLHWLGALLKANEIRVQRLGEEALIHLLEWNYDVGSPWPVLLHWTLDQCYEAKEARMRRVCFHALVKTYQNNVDYPCNDVALILVCLLYASPSVSDSLMQHKALQLFQLIYHRCFVLTSRDLDFTAQKQVIIESTWRSIPTQKATELSRLLSMLHPDLTMPLFSEFCLRFEQSMPLLRGQLCQYILPWMYNIHLLDSWFVLDHRPNLERTCPMCEKSGGAAFTRSVTGIKSFSGETDIQLGSPTGNATASGQRSSNRVSGVFSVIGSNSDLRPCLIGEGWWSKEASEMVVNNLYYLTLRYGVCVGNPLEQLWRALLPSREHNLCVILHFIILITSVVPHTLLTTSKRVLNFLCTPDKASRIVEFLISELQVLENCNFQLEHLPSPPFLRIILPSSSNSSGLGKGAQSQFAENEFTEKRTTSSEFEGNVSGGRYRTSSANYSYSVTNNKSSPQETRKSESREVKQENGPPIQTRMKEQLLLGTDAQLKRQTLHWEGPSSLKPFFNVPQNKPQQQLLQQKSGRTSNEDLGGKSPRSSILQPCRLRNVSTSPEKTCEELDSILQNGTADMTNDGDKFGTLRAPRCASQPNPNALIHPHSSSGSSGVLLTNATSRFSGPTILQSPTSVDFQGNGISFYDEIILSLAMPPHSLPMPASGTYWAPLNWWLAPAHPIGTSILSSNTENNSTGTAVAGSTFSNPWPTHYRNSVLLMLMNDLLLINSHVETTNGRGNILVDWHRHIPLILHCSILGLDHGQFLVHEQCKLLLLNLLRGVLCPRVDLFRRAALLLQSSLVGATCTDGDKDWSPCNSIPNHLLSTEGGPCRDRFVSSTQEGGLSHPFSMSLLSVECCGCCESSLQSNNSNINSSNHDNETVQGHLDQSHNSLPHSCELCSSLPGLLWSPSLGTSDSEISTFDPNLIMMPGHEDTHTFHWSGMPMSGIERVASTTSVNSIATLIPVSAVPPHLWNDVNKRSHPLIASSSTATHLLQLRKNLHHSAQKIIQLLLSRPDQPLWVWEDVSVNKFFQWKRSELLQSASTRCRAKSSSNDLAAKSSGNATSSEPLADISEVETTVKENRPSSCCSNVSHVGQTCTDEADAIDSLMWCENQTQLSSSRTLMYLVTLLSRLLRQYNELYNTHLPESTQITSAHSTTHNSRHNISSKRRCTSTGSAAAQHSSQTHFSSTNIAPITSNSWIQHLLLNRWPQLALNMGLRCTHRHHAARSLQIYRALQLTLTSRVQMEVLSRLIETISDLASDVQSYVCELYLTLENGFAQLRKTLLLASVEYRGLKDARNRESVQTNENDNQAKNKSSAQDNEINVPGGVHFLRTTTHLHQPTHRFRPSVNFMRFPPLECLNEQQSPCNSISLVPAGTPSQIPDVPKILHVVTAPLNGSFSFTDTPSSSFSAGNKLKKKAAIVASNSTSSLDSKASAESLSPVLQPRPSPRPHFQRNEELSLGNRSSPSLHSEGSPCGSPSPEKHIPLIQHSRKSESPSADSSPRLKPAESSRTVLVRPGKSNIIVVRPNSSKNGIARPQSVMVTSSDRERDSKTSRSGLPSNSNSPSVASLIDPIDLRSHDSVEQHMRKGTPLTHPTALTTSASASSLSNLAASTQENTSGNILTSLSISGSLTNTNRSRTVSMHSEESPQNTKTQEPTSPPSSNVAVAHMPDDVEEVLCAVYWVSLAFLQSDFEYEYQCGLSLLDHWFSLRSLEYSTTLEKLSQQQKRQLQIQRQQGKGNEEMTALPILLPLLLKGATHVTLYEPMCHLLSRILMLNTTLITSLVEPSIVENDMANKQSMCFPICVFTLLPLLIEHFIPGQMANAASGASGSDQKGHKLPLICVLIAENISWKADQLSSQASLDVDQQVSQNRNAQSGSSAGGSGYNVPTDYGASLKSLSAVMRLYSTQSFMKDVNQWIKCCVKYLLDAYASSSAILTTFLAKLIYMGPTSLQPALAQFTNCFVQTLDLSRNDLDAPVKELIDAAFNRFLHTAYWGEVLKSLRAVVSRSSILTTPPIPAEMEFSRQLPLVPLPEAECPRLELPGRTLHMNLDVCRFPLAGMSAVSNGNNINTLLHPSRSPFLPQQPAWLRPNCTQALVRERMLQILNLHGSSSPRRPSTILKSPSVIFSQSTETLDRPLGSVISSSDTTSMNDISNPDEGKNFDDSSSLEQVQVLRNLDRYLDAQLPKTFLDLDSDSWDDDDDRKPPWGVRKQSITHHRDFLEGGHDGFGGNEDSSALGTSMFDSAFLQSEHVGGELSRISPNNVMSLSMRGQMVNYSYHQQQNSERESASWVHEAQMLESNDMLLKRRSISLGHFYRTPSNSSGGLMDSGEQTNSGYSLANENYQSNSISMTSEVHPRFIKHTTLPSGMSNLNKHPNDLFLMVNERHSKTSSLPTRPGEVSQIEMINSYTDVFSTASGKRLMDEQDKDTEENYHLADLLNEEERFYQCLQSLADLVDNEDEARHPNLSSIPLLSNVARLLPSAMALQLHFLREYCQKLVTFLQEVINVSTQTMTSLTEEDKNSCSGYVNILNLFLSLSDVLQSYLPHCLPFVFINQAEDIVKILSPLQAQSCLLALQLMELFSELKAKILLLRDSVEEITFAPSALSRLSTLNGEMISQSCFHMHKCYLQLQMVWENSLKFYVDLGNHLTTVTNKNNINASSLQEAIRFCMKSVIPSRPDFSSSKSLLLSSDWETWNQAEVDWHKNESLAETFTLLFDRNSPLPTATKAQHLINSLLKHHSTTSNRKTQEKYSFLPGGLLGHKLSSSICQYFCSAHGNRECVIVFVSLCENVDLLSPSLDAILKSQSGELFQYIANRLCHIQRILKQPRGTRPAHRPSNSVSTYPITPEKLATHNKSYSNTFHDSVVSKMPSIVPSSKMPFNSLSSSSRSTALYSVHPTEPENPSLNTSGNNKILRHMTSDA